MTWPIHDRNTLGLLALDADAAKVAKVNRARFLVGAAVTVGEKDPGVANTTGKRLAEPGNALFWKHAGKEPPRGAWGSWSFAMPAIQTAAGLLPLETPTTADQDFIPWQEGEDYETLADGVLVVQTTGHGTRKPVAIPIGNQLVAATDFARLNQPRELVAGDPFGSKLHERTANNAPGGVADISTILQSVESPRGPGESVVAGQDNNLAGLWAGNTTAPQSRPRNWQRLNIDRTNVRFNFQRFDRAAGMLIGRDGPVATSVPVGGWLGSSGGGPIVLRDLYPTAHYYGEAADRRWSRAALDTNAVWTSSLGHQLWSGPQYFVEPSNNVAWSFHNRDDPEVLLRFDPESGYWRWSLPSMAFAPAIPPEEVRNNRVVNINNVNNNFPINVNVNNHQWNIGPWNINVNINPGNGDPIDPERHGKESARPSLHGTGQRTGRWGGPPVDNPESPWDEIINGGLPTGSPEAQNGLQPPSDALAPPTSGVLQSLAHRFSEVLKEQRKNESTGKPWVEAPMVWNIQTIADVDQRDRPVSPTLQKGQFYVRSGTADGLMYVTPPEVIYDAAADPPAVSNTAMLFYNGSNGGNAMELAFGRPATALDGTWNDGWSLTSTTVSGSINATWNFLDANGSNRSGTLSIRGSILPTGTQDLGSLSAEWNKLYATDVCVSGELDVNGGTNLGVYRDTNTVNITEATPWNVFANTDGGAITINLPAAPANGTSFRIVNTGSSGNSATVAADASDDLIGSTGGTVALVDSEALIITFHSSDGWY